MKWDGKTAEAEIKQILYSHLLYESDISEALKMDNQSYADHLKKTHRHHGHWGGGIHVEGKNNGIDLEFRNENNEVVKYSLTWSMAARHIRAWEYENRNNACVPIERKAQEVETMTPTFDFAAFSSQNNQLKTIPIDLLDYNNDYERYSGEQMSDMVFSIKQNGILQPLIVRSMPDGRFYILAGNNRRFCGEQAGLTAFPCIVKENLTDEEAQAYIDETNVYQRGFASLKITKQAEVVARRHSQMFDKEKLRAIQSEIAALGGEAVEEDTNEKQLSKLAKVGTEYGLGKDSIARLIRINSLTDELKPFIDDKLIAVRAAVALSYLFASEQRKVAELVGEGYTVDMKKSSLLREISEQKQLNDRMIEVILSGQYDPSKAAPKPKTVKLKTETVEKYFPPEATSEEIQNIIDKALEHYFKEEAEFDEDDTASNSDI